MSDPTEQVARVSKAIWDADDMAAKPDFAWDGTTRASYDCMAQAAIDALQPDIDFLKWLLAESLWHEQMRREQVVELRAQLRLEGER